MVSIRKKTDEENRRQQRQGQCPSCGHQTDFQYVGEQHWPPRVVEKTGMGPVVHLWMCSHCRTTVTENAPAA